MYKTYGGWKRAGRQVLPGTRSSFRNEYGDPMFHINCTGPVRYREVITRVYY